MRSSPGRRWPWPVRVRTRRSGWRPRRQPRERGRTRRFARRPRRRPAHGRTMPPAKQPRSRRLAHGRTRQRRLPLRLRSGSRLRRRSIRRVRACGRRLAAGRRRRLRCAGRYRGSDAGSSRRPVRSPWRTSWCPGYGNARRCRHRPAAPSRRSGKLSSDTGSGGTRFPWHSPFPATSLRRIPCASA